MPVESLFPQGWERFELGSSGWSRVLGIDAVGSSPYRDFANEGGGMTSRGGPGWRAVTLAEVILNLVGEVGDKLGSLCQVAAPDGIGMEREWNAREPGQRTSVNRRERWEAPVEDGGHVAGTAEVAPDGGCQQVAEGVLTSLRRQVEEMCTQGRPSRFVGEPRDEQVDSVELRHGPGSDELFGCDVEAVGVALDRLEKPGRRVVELA